MSRQALSIERMKHLHELGLETSSGSAYWYRIIQNKGDGNIRVISDWKLTFSIDIAYCTGHTLESIRTFTLQDILDLLPKEIITNDFHRDTVRLTLDFFDYSFGYAYYFETCGGLSFYKKESFHDGYLLIDAAYEMLCWVLTNKYIQ